MEKRRRIVRDDLEGWDAIADALGKSVTTVKSWSKREGDPLPVKRAMGRLFASSEQISLWWDRQCSAA